MISDTREGRTTYVSFLLGYTTEKCKLDAFSE